MVYTRKAPCVHASIRMAAQGTQLGNVKLWFNFVFPDVSSLLMICFLLMAGPTSEPQNDIEAPTTEGKEGHLISILHITWREAKLVIWNAKVF